MTRLDVLGAALESRCAIDTRDPKRTFVLDLIEGSDEIRSHTDACINVSEGLGQRYTYARPQNAGELQSILAGESFDIVIVDAHGTYDRRTDTLHIGPRERPVPLDDLIPFTRVPPVWILSACDTSVTGAMRGCFVRKLLSLGAICVVATLARVDAFTASMFVGSC